MLGAITVNYIYANPEYSIVSGADSEMQARIFMDAMVADANQRGVTVSFDDRQIEEDMMNCYISDNLHVMMPVSIVRDYLECKLSYPSDTKLKLRKGSTELLLCIGSGEAYANQVAFTLRDAVVEKDGIVYVPIEDIATYLHVRTQYRLVDNVLAMSSIPYEEDLPESYDMRAENRMTEVRNQGKNANCWAYANLGAAESTLMPEEHLNFSANYMSKHSGFQVPEDMGGDYLMAVAYMARWAGPVERKTESDGTDAGKIEIDGRPVLKHLEQAVFPAKKDYETIKNCVYKYGGVVSSLYINLDLENDDEGSSYYNKDQSSYYFDGEAETNHAVVIVGWDDHYSRENFSVKPEEDGAFICKNSWGTKFGEEGYFYISYYDVNIGLYNCCYTVLADVDNYDYNYQADKLGWVGELGYDCSNAYMANVYTAHEDELLKAVAFYTTDKDTSYKVYAVKDYTDSASFKNRVQVAEGTLDQSGYYTVTFDNAVPLAAGERFAVVVYLDTPGSVHPVAIEYNGNERTETFDVTDGEGYVSLYGEAWTNVEQKQNANVCLKAFTDKTGNTQ